MKERAGNQSVKRQSLSELLSTLPIDWQWVTHPRLIVLRSQFKSELPPCRGGIKNNECVSLCRRGLLANVSVGVSVQLHALVVGNGSYILRPCGHDLHGPAITL